MENVVVHRQTLASASSCPRERDYYLMRVYVGALTVHKEYICVNVTKSNTAEEVVNLVLLKLHIRSSDQYDLVEGMCVGGEVCKERRLAAEENPLCIQMLWPRPLSGDREFRFFLRRHELERRISKNEDESDSNIDNFLGAFLRQPPNKEYPDLCNLPNLNESTLMQNLRARFEKGYIYTYVGSILIAVNPFRFYPIYNPKYVKMYQNHRLGELPPHIFAVADAAFHTMLSTKSNQCIVISGESGSGKTESTNLLLHHLSALSHCKLPDSGIEQAILCAGPVMEAFGNAKTVHNNNSSRFGKFIQVNYKENGMVHGALVEKYLLEKSRIVSQAQHERNYHVFYYLLAGLAEHERNELWLTRPEDYHYLNQSKCFVLEDVDGQCIDEAHEFTRLKQSMEMVGFSADTKRRLFTVLAAILHIGNVEFRKKSDQIHHESVAIKNLGIIKVISMLLKVKESTLVDALTKKKAVAGGEKVVMQYKMQDAIATRDAMAKCLYGAIFEWIVLQINHAFLAKRENKQHQVLYSIGVLDIFGFEDFRKNSFEQFCINYANEHLHYYFNQHIFKFEQEEYQREGIQWKNIEFIDNTGCLDLFAHKPTGLLCLLDEECSFPGASNESLLAKFHAQHKSNHYYEIPQVKENAFAIRHYAGKVKYAIKDFREKNNDLMRQDIEFVLKNSSLAFVRELVGNDPVAMMRWALLRVFFRSYFAFIEAGRRGRRPSGTGRWGSIKGRSSSRNSRSSTGGINYESSSDLSPDCDNMRLPEKVLSVDTGYPSVFRTGQSDPLHSLGASQDSFAYNPQDKVIYRANKLILKNKSNKKSKKNMQWSRNMKAMKTVAGRTVVSTRKNKQPSVSTQFSLSLSKLMESLCQGNPFFVRCIKSNGEKEACKFDDEQVLRQLRYTGMLATVLIRQSGYNYRLTFEEFIQHYQILLPHGLLSSQDDVHHFLHNSDLNPDNFQLGNSKVFLREKEKLALDEALHLAIMKRIRCIQRWVRARLQRFHFLEMKDSVLILQSHLRCYMAKRKLEYLRSRLYAVICIQRFLRGHRVRQRLKRLHLAATHIQRLYRGYKARLRFRALKAQKEKEEEEQAAIRKLKEEEEALKREINDRKLKEEEDALKREISDKDLEYQLHYRTDTDMEDVKTHSAAVITQDNNVVPDQDTMRRTFDKSSSDIASVASDVQSVKESSSRQADRDSKYVAAEESCEVPEESTKSSSTSELLPDTSRSPQPVGAFVNPAFEQDTPLKRDTSQSSSEVFQSAEPNVPERPHILIEPANEQASNIRSPFYRAIKPLRNFMGGSRKQVKKDLTDESDDEAETPSTPRDEVFSATSNDESSSKRDIKTPKSPDIHVDTSLIPDFKPKKKLRKNSKKRRQAKSDSDSHKTNMASNNNSSGGSNWKVSGSNLWEYPDEYAIHNSAELQQLDQFIFLKIMELSKDCAGRRDTVFDTVFKGTLKDFHTSLLSQSSLEESCKVIRYKDLMTNFEATLKARMKEENTNATFPITMGINAFRGFLDEFHKKKETKESKETEVRVNRKEKKRKDKEVITEMLGHLFVLTSFSIPTYCEYCNSLIWVDKGQVCKSCKYTCHRKCCSKSQVICKGFQSQPQVSQGKDKQVMGVPLVHLLTGRQLIPPVIEKLITAIELHGLYTEGLYRKTGAASKIRQLVKTLNAEGDSVELSDYRIHVLTSALKVFFREMPEPLLTYEHHDQFLRISDIEDPRERVQTVYAIINQLPTAHHNMLERLMFHLARVAQFESANKMSTNSLAILFAPCILRSNKAITAQESLSQMPRQIVCIQTIIDEQLKKLITTLADIDTLKTAELTVSDHLSAVRASLRKKAAESERRAEEVSGPETTEEKALTEQIRTIRKEKDELTSNLTTLEEFRMGSSDEDILGQDDLDAGKDDSHILYDEYAITFELPVSPPRDLRHLNKHRVTTPSRKHPRKSKCSSTSSTSSQSHDESLNLSSYPETQATDADAYLMYEFVTISELQTVGDEILV